MDFIESPKNKQEFCKMFKEIAEYITQPYIILFIIIIFTFV
jgi:hypothetical protein